MGTRMDRYSLGRLCIERGLLSEEELEQCLEEQRASPNPRRLGEIMLSHGYVTGVTLAQLLSLQEALRRAAPEDAEAAYEPPPATELGWMLKEGWAYGARGVVLGPGRAPAFTLGGRTELLEGPPLESEQFDKLLAEALPAALVRRLEREPVVEAVVTLAGQGSVRTTLYRHADGVGAAFRVLVGPAPDLASLGLPPGTRELQEATSGLVLVTGPCGCGKTTTIATLLERINESRPCHIALIERCATTVLLPKSSRLTRLEVGHPELDEAGDATGAVAAAIERALRFDADVIAIDPLEDRGDVVAAMAAAEAGRLVIATLPTGGAVATIERVIAAFPRARAARARSRVASCLRAVLCQRLFPRARGGRPALAVELLLGTPAVAALVREGRLEQIPTVLHAKRADGMTSLEASLDRLCRKGVITHAVAVEAANEPQRLQQPAAARVREAPHAGH